MLVQDGRDFFNVRKIQDPSGSWLIMREYSHTGYTAEEHARAKRRLAACVAAGRRARQGGANCATCGGDGCNLAELYAPEIAAAAPAPRPTTAAPVAVPIVLGPSLVSDAHRAVRDFLAGGASFHPSVLAERDRRGVLHTAVHESGHAVGAFLGDDVIHSLSVVRDSATRGRMTSSTWEAADLESTRARLTMHFAGAAAELSWFGATAGGESDDVAAAATLAEAIAREPGASSASAEIAAAKLRAEAMFEDERHVDAALVLAVALLREGSLDGVAVMEILERELAAGARR